MDDEIWTTKDGRRLLVKDMDSEHCRNVLRMLLRRKRQTERAQALLLALLRASPKGDDTHEWTEGEIQDHLSAQAWNDLSNPQVFFPLLDGGKYGSPELAARHDPRRKT